MRIAIPAVLLLSLAFACRHRTGTGDTVPADCGTPGTPATPGGVLSKIEVKLDNCDDVCSAALNGTQVASVSLDGPSGNWQDISLQAYPVAGCNKLRFVEENRSGGWTYGFHVRVDDVAVFDSSCGTRLSVGCADNDLTVGTNHDETFTF